MDRLRELHEARDAARDVIVRIDHAMGSLDKASFWGTWDLFGGDFITSMIKRNRIKESNQDISEMMDALKGLNKELEDVNMVLPAEISDTVSDTVWDLWLDNIFIDIRVQGEIKDSLKELSGFRASIQDLIAKLDEEIQMMDQSE